MDQPKYDPQEPVGIKLARLETKVDVLLTGTADHEKRIRSVEKNLWTFSGAAAVLGACASALLEGFRFHA